MKFSFLVAQYTYDRGAKNTFSISNNFPIKEEEEESMRLDVFSKNY